MGNKSGNLGIRSAIVRIETIKKDLFDLLSFDADESGKNGEEYLMNIAKENGFDNNLSFWIDSAVEHSKEKMDVKSIVLNVLSHFDCYWDTDVSLIQIDNYASYCAVAFVS